MRYQGGKSKQWPHIVPLIERFLKKKSKTVKDCTYVEPFMGGGNIFTRVNWPTKVCNDIDPDMVSLWKHLASGGEIPSADILTQELYDELKYQDKSGDRKKESWLYGLVSHICSYGGKKWGGYAHYNPKRGENHISEAISSLEKQVHTDTFSSDFCNMLFNSGDYLDLKIEDGSVVYCDPPYETTTGYGTDFDHKTFWNWCRDLVKRNCTVLVSEYDAPKDFKCIWRGRKPDGMGTTKKGKKQKVKIEKLFVCRI